MWVFGSRHPKAGLTQPRIQPLEAQVVQLLASAVSAGNARLEQQAEATRLHVQLEQFASPELVRELERQPDLLQPAGREITVLFGDLRGFSRICETLSPEDTYRLVSDAMERLTACIAGRGGFVIDYSGDGIGAMWNAPATQPDHAARAAAAAVTCSPRCPSSRRGGAARSAGPCAWAWDSTPGSARSATPAASDALKYSPLGHHVNLASRVEGATKQLGVDCLVTDATRAAIVATPLCLPGSTAPPSTPPPALTFRRLCQVRVLGIQQPVTLHQLLADPHGEGSPVAGPDNVKFHALYESALIDYENRRPGGTLALLDGCDPAWLERDPPTRRLRAAAKVAVDSAGYDPVWNLDQK